MSDVELAASLARDAGQLLLGLRDAPNGPTGKELGREGDRRSNDLLLDRLGAERPGDAVLSEEAVDDKSRLRSERVWIIDPLDGTREYGMSGRTDWAVHVALWTSGVGIGAAAVAQPARGEVYSSADSRPARSVPAAPLRVVVSDSRPPAFVKKLRKRLGAQIIPMGSAGAKAMAVLRGDADAYVHAGGQWEWDSAAPVGVALSAGLHCSRIDGSPLRYNADHPYLPDLIICDPRVAETILRVVA
ncbi:3'(2'),5'-bisphosphate nucleotidase CysQ [Skermania sp. ID1734]|nr:3'(2'),5'-bisphosphate nucleotidase CysQ [Skermania sp. ID1734]